MISATSGLVAVLAGEDDKYRLASLSGISVGATISARLIEAGWFESTMVIASTTWRAMRERTLSIEEFMANLFIDSGQCIVMTPDEFPHPVLMVQPESCLCYSYAIEVTIYQIWWVGNRRFRMEGMAEREAQQALLETAGQALREVRAMLQVSHD